MDLADVLSDRPSPSPAELARVLSVLLPDGRRKCRLCDTVTMASSSGGHTNFKNHLRTKKHVRQYIQAYYELRELPVTMDDVFNEDDHGHADGADTTSSDDETEGDAAPPGMVSAKTFTHYVAKTNKKMKLLLDQVTSLADQLQVERTARKQLEDALVGRLSHAGRALVNLSDAMRLRVEQDRAALAPREQAPRRRAPRMRQELLNAEPSSPQGSPPASPRHEPHVERESPHAMPRSAREPESPEPRAERESVRSEASTDQDAERPPRAPAAGRGSGRRGAKKRRRSADAQEE